LGVTDAGALHRVEYLYAAQRQQEITDGHVAVPATFDADHLKAVHAHLFGDVYEWAGQWRTVNMSKNSSTFADYRGELEMRVGEGAKVAASTDWAQLDREGFAQSMGAFYAEVNHAHPFREGNGRATKLLLTQLAERSPYRLDFDRISGSEWNQAAERSSPRGPGWPPEPASLVPIFRGMTIDRDPSPTQSAGSEAARIAGLSHPRSISEQLTARSDPGRNTPAPSPRYGLGSHREAERGGGYER